jgi:hypothetical protein
MPLTHTLNLADGTADLTLTWTPVHGGTAVSEGDGGQNRLELGRDDIFAMIQWCDAVLSQMNFGEREAEEED